MAPLQVIALISGGKDSFLSLLHCVAQGHHIVALANLYPSPPSSALRSQDDDADPEEANAAGDLDSFMYQTVGHQVIPYYEKLTGIPLHRRQISGSNVQSGLDYNASLAQKGHMDETEDLMLLLQDICKHHPEANAVSSGAILSNYQRTRVESVCSRMGLTSLAYLWQYPYLPPPVERPDSITGLLDDMAAANLDARIIKIASAGVQPGLMGENVTASKTRAGLVRSQKRLDPNISESELRAAVLGEGGEYETLVIGNPSLFNGRIVFNESMAVFRGSGGVDYLQTDGLEAEYFQKYIPPVECSVRTPFKFDPQFSALLEKVVGDATPARTSLSLHPPAVVSRTELSCMLNRQQKHDSGDHWVLSNIASNYGGSAAEQMQDIANSLHHHLLQMEEDASISEPITPMYITFTLLLLASMDDFATVNEAYKSIFPTGRPNPPARVTISTDLPDGILVSLTAIVSKIPLSERAGLHVQSRSYWAPANIGPYSQAITEPLGSAPNHTSPKIVYLAGQIPLKPQTMTLETGLVESATLALQNLWRVAQARQADLFPFGVAFTASLEPERFYDYSFMLLKCWRKAHEYLPPNSTKDDNDEEEEVDPWETKYNSQHPTATRPGEQDDIGHHLHTLPHQSFKNKPAALPPPCLIVNVKALPMGASLEWWSMGLSSVAASITDPDVITTFNTNKDEHHWTYTIDITSDGSSGIASRFFSTGFRTSHQNTDITPLEAGQGDHTDDDIEQYITQHIPSNLLQPPNHNNSKANFKLGFAFIATPVGWRIFRRLQESNTWFAGVTAIPCSGVWCDEDFGCCSPATTRSEGSEGGGNGGQGGVDVKDVHMKSLSFAMVGRVDF